MLDALPMTLHLDPMEPQKRAEIERERALTRLEQQRRAEAKGSRGSTCSRGLPLPPQASSKQAASKQAREEETCVIAYRQSNFADFTEP